MHVAIAVVTILGAGWSSVMTWLQVAATTSKVAGLNGGVSSFIPSFGLPPIPFGVFATAVILLTCLTVFLARRRPGLAFAAAVIGAALATPYHPGSFALLLPAVAPFAMSAVHAGQSDGPDAAALLVAPS